MGQNGNRTLARADCGFSDAVPQYSWARQSKIHGSVLSDECGRREGKNSGWRSCDRVSPTWAESAQIESRRIFCVSGLVKAMLKQSLTFFACARPGRAIRRFSPPLQGVPAGAISTPRPAAGLGALTRRFVFDNPHLSKRDACASPRRVEKAGQVRCPAANLVNIANRLQAEVPPIHWSQEAPPTPLSAHLPWGRARHWPSACDQAESHFPLRQKRFLNGLANTECRRAGRSHVTFQRAPRRIKSRWTTRAPAVKPRRVCPAHAFQYRRP